MGEISLDMETFNANNMSSTNKDMKNVYKRNRRSLHKLREQGLGDTHGSHLERNITGKSDIIPVSSNLPNDEICNFERKCFGNGKMLLNAKSNGLISSVSVCSHISSGEECQSQNLKLNLKLDTISESGNENMDDSSVIIKYKAQQEEAKVMDLKEDMDGNRENSDITNGRDENSMHCESPEKKVDSNNFENDTSNGISMPTTGLEENDEERIETSGLQNRNPAEDVEVDHCLDENGVRYISSISSGTGYEDLRSSLEMAISGSLQNDNESIKIEKDHVSLVPRQNNSTETHSLYSHALNVGCFDVFDKTISSKCFKDLHSLIICDFYGSRIPKILDFQLVESRLKSGTYGASPDQFAADLIQFCDNIVNAGKKVVSYAEELRRFSERAYQSKVLVEVDKGSKIDTAERDSAVNTMNNVNDIQLNAIQPSDNTEMHKDDEIRTNLTQEGVSVNSQCQPAEHIGRPRSGTDGTVCTTCGFEVTASFLICDSCEGSYHMECLDPPVENVPNGSWYCFKCSQSEKEVLKKRSCGDREASVEDGEQKIAYHCHVCEVLAKLTTNVQNSQEESENASGKNTPNSHKRKTCMSAGNSDSGETVNTASEAEPLNKRGRRKVRCKFCKQGPKDDDTLIKCSHSQCLFIYYHLRCLKPPLEEEPPSGWYCPSCICRVCLKDENDGSVILCDVCDQGYHTYCVTPRLNKVPKGEWKCMECQQQMMMQKTSNKGSQDDPEYGNGSLTKSNGLHNSSLHVRSRPAATHSSRNLRRAAKQKVENAIAFKNGRKLRDRQ